MEMYEGFVQSIDDRFGDAETTDDIPVIDLESKQGDIVAAVAEASEKWGFFQVTKHGIPHSLLDSMLELTREFFHMPIEDKEACNALNETLQSDNPYGILKYGMSFNPLKETAPDLRYFFRISCGEVRKRNAWPTKPDSFKNIVSAYNEEVANLVKRLLGIISQGLGLENSQSMWHQFGTKLEHLQVLRMNYSPCYPNLELVKGASAHSDPMGITVLLQDSVGGLEVCKDGTWFAVKPIKHALVVNLGDQMQVLTNGKYMSAEHRARVHSSRERVSIATFYGPNDDMMIGPIPQLVKHDGVAKYNECMTKDYLAHHFSTALQGKNTLDYVKI